MRIYSEDGIARAVHVSKSTPLGKICTSGKPKAVCRWVATQYYKEIVKPNGEHGRLRLRLFNGRFAHGLGDRKRSWVSETCQRPVLVFSEARESPARLQYCGAELVLIYLESLIYRTG
jgi:hypothetical protein